MYDYIDKHHLCPLQRYLLFTISLFIIFILHYLLFTISNIRILPSLYTFPIFHRLERKYPVTGTKLQITKDYVTRKSIALKGHGETHNRQAIPSFFSPGNDPITRHFHRVQVPCKRKLRSWHLLLYTTRLSP